MKVFWLREEGAWSKVEINIGWVEEKNTVSINTNNLM